MNQQSFRLVHVFFDSEGSLIGIPTSITKKEDAIVMINHVMELKTGYSESELELFLTNLFSLCYSYQPESITDGSPPLQHYLGVKSWKSAVKGRGLVLINWVYMDKYQFIPTWQDPKTKNGFAHLPNRSIVVSSPYEPGELASAFREAMKLSPIGPQDSPPQ